MIPCVDMVFLTISSPVGLVVSKMPQPLPSRQQNAAVYLWLLRLTEEVLKSTSFPHLCISKPLSLNSNFHLNPSSFVLRVAQIG